MKISEEVRRKILDKLLVIGNCFGLQGRAVDFVRRVAPNYKNIQNVERHMDRFSDWGNDQLFYSELKLLSVADDDFIYFCKEYMNPVFNRKKRRKNEDFEYYTEDLNIQCLEAINDGLKYVNYELVPDDENEGYYKVITRVELPTEQIKNIVFASNKTKPDIVVNNALENSIKIIDAGDALVYEDGIPENGLSWMDLVKWYKKFENEDTQDKLKDRLVASLSDSPPEKLFFETYYEFVLQHSGNIPALIPQVYLYYDPQTKKNRGGKPVFEHQRMDFMFIISREHRVVIEIDGIQHYAKDSYIDGTHYKCADVNRYSEMMKAHREMVLDGYDVYRFGGKELYVGADKNEKPAKQVVFNFLEGLFRKYRIITEEN